MLLTGWTVSAANVYADQKTDILIQKLSGKDINTRKEAVAEIGAMNNISGARLLLTAADDNGLQPEIIQSFSRFTDTAVVKFLQDEALVFPNNNIRLIAARALSEMGFKGDEYYAQVITPLSKSITDSSVAVRLAVVQAVSNYISPGHTPELIDNDNAIFPLLAQALDDDDYPQVREAAAYVLIRFIANPRILKCLLRRYHVEGNLTVLWTIEDLLIEQSDSQTLDYLANTGLNSNSMAVRALSARILGRRQAAEYVELLRPDQSDSNEVIAAKTWARSQIEPVKNPVGPEKTDVSYVKLPSILNLRFGAKKDKALKEWGASPQTEQAVARGLEWLARKQEENGSWSCSLHNPWHGKLSLPGFTSDEDELLDPAVTGLSLLAFAASGSTHHYGRYINIVEKGMRYLLYCQDRDGCINLEKDHRHNQRCLRSGLDHGDLVRRYNHNIGTMALVELYAMTKDPVLKPYAQRALNHSREYVMKDYAWSFYLEPTDIGPSIFYIFALNMAGQTDLMVSPDDITRAKTYIRTLTDARTGRILHICSIPVCYGGFDSTATGIVARFLINLFDEPNKPVVAQFIEPNSPMNRATTKKPDEILKEVQAKARDFIKGHPPVWRPMYQLPSDLWESQFIQGDILNEWYWYYGTMAQLALGGPDWSEWNKQMQSLLLRHQRQGGDWDGSWDPDGPWANVGGRIYSTAFAIMTLQAYYSYDLNK
ncbi:MAG: HEAT repeat domain-containing protein [Planctomycetota bacterium]